MIIIVPRTGASLSTVLNSLVDIPIKTILSSLTAAKEEYVGDNVRVSLPKFQITSDLVLNSVLDKVSISV